MARVRVILFPSGSYLYDMDFHYLPRTGDVVVMATSEHYEVSQVIHYPIGSKSVGTEIAVYPIKEE